MSTLLTLHVPRAAQSHYEAGLWRGDTFYTLLRRHAAERPNDFSLRDARQRLSWSSLLDAVDSVAADLASAGIRPGQRVSVWLPSRVEAVIIFLACSRNGYVCNPSLHQNYTVSEIIALLTRIRSAAFFAQPGYGADSRTHDIFTTAAALSGLRRIYTVEPGPDASPFPTRVAPADAPPAIADADKIVYLAFTSGTTGPPKGVMHSDNTLLANGRAMVADWQHDTRSILLSLSPISHHIGTVAIEQMMAAGMELVLNAPPPGLTSLDWIVESGASYVMGVPTHAMDILAEMRQRGRERLGAVRTFYMAGSPIPRETAQAFRDCGIMPQNVYGMTENGSHQYTLPDDPEQTIVETCGRSCAAYEIRLWDQECPDREVAPGSIGEIGGRGACLMLGYFDNQTATEDSFNSSGWFMSGDLGRLDEKGCLEIVGRKKDLIIRGGHNIHPARIEDLAMRHAAVAKCAVFAVPDPRLGERMCLAVIFHTGAEASPEALLDHLFETGLSKYDMPEYFIDMPAFPLTASGKILKRELVDWARAGSISPVPVRWTDPAKRSAAPGP